MDEQKKIILDALRERISRQIGHEITVTIRGEAKFTFSTDDVTPGLEDKLREFFGDRMTLTTTHDDECGTFVYADVAAA